MKTAGTSIEVSLSGICGPDDVITPLLSPVDELSRKKLGYRGMQNYKLQNGIELYNHASAAIVKNAVGEDIWNEYFKFCFERNPWDKVISEYYWKHHSRMMFVDLPTYFESKNITFDEFIQSGRFTRISREGGIGLYVIDGIVAVDKVFLYENLNDEYYGLSHRFGLEQMPELPFLKSGPRIDRRPYQEIFTENQRKIVETVCKREIELFNYVF